MASARSNRAAGLSLIVSRARPDQRQLLLPPGDNYFCRWVGRADGLCDGAELRAPAGCRGSWSPDGQRQAGPLAEEEADGEQDVGGGRVGRRDEREDGAHVAARAAALGDEGAAHVAHAAGPVRGGVVDGDRAAAGGGQGGQARGEDHLRRALPQEAGRVRAGAGAHAAAAGAGVARGARAGQGGVLPAGARARAHGVDRLHARDGARRHRSPGCCSCTCSSSSCWRTAAGGSSSWRSARRSRRWSRGCRARCGRLGGVPQRVRQDNLSAATHELAKTGGRGLTTAVRGRGGALRFHAVAHPAGRVARKWRRRRRRIICSRARSSRRSCCVAAATSRASRRTWRSSGGSSRRRFTRGARLGSPRSAPCFEPLPSSRVPEYTRVVVDGAQVEHHPRGGPHLLGAVATDRARSRGAQYTPTSSRSATRTSRSRRCRGCAARASIASTTGT